MYAPCCRSFAQRLGRRLGVGDAFVELAPRRVSGSDGREASGLDGELTQSDVCDDSLQRRHASKRLRLPPGLVDKLEAIERAVPALLPLREAVVELVAACAKSGGSSSSGSSGSAGSSSSCALVMNAMPSYGASRASDGSACCALRRR